jgi:hypothetical protein
MMESFREFLDHMSSQLPDNFLSQTDEQSNCDLAMRAAYLWSLLQMIQEDLNALSRRSHHARLGPMSVETINRAFGEIKELIADDYLTSFLPSLDPGNPPTHSDALMTVAIYKQCLRRFRVDKLQEDPFRF